MNKLTIERRQIGPILVLEDEALVSTLIEDLVRELGASDVFVFGDAPMAEQMARNATLDCAILDVQVGRHDSFGVADILEERGIPFLFSSAYGRESLHERHRHRPIIGKPFADGDLTAELLRLLNARESE